MKHLATVKHAELNSDGDIEATLIVSGAEGWRFTDGTEVTISEQVDWDKVVDRAITSAANSFTKEDTE